MEFSPQLRWFVGDRWKHQGTPGILGSALAPDWMTRCIYAGTLGTKRKQTDSFAAGTIAGQMRAASRNQSGWWRLRCFRICWHASRAQRVTAGLVQQRSKGQTSSQGLLELWIKLMEESGLARTFDKGLLWVTSGPIFLGFCSGFFGSSTGLLIAKAGSRASAPAPTDQPLRSRSEKGHQNWIPKIMTAKPLRVQRQKRSDAAERRLYPFRGFIFCITQVQAGRTCLLFSFDAIS